MMVRKMSLYVTHGYSALFDNAAECLCPLGAREKCLEDRPRLVSISVTKLQVNVGSALTNQGRIQTLAVVSRHEDDPSFARGGTVERVQNACKAQGVFNVIVF